MDKYRVVICSLGFIISIIILIIGLLINPAYDFL